MKSTNPCQRKPDAKSLAGPDLRDTLNPFGDKAGTFEAAVCAPRSQQSQATWCDRNPTAHRSVHYERRGFDRLAEEWNVYGLFRFDHADKSCAFAVAERGDEPLALAPRSTWEAGLSLACPLRQLSARDLGRVRRPA